MISYSVRHRLTATCGIETITGRDCYLQIPSTNFIEFSSIYSILLPVPAWTVGVADYEEVGLSRILIKEFWLKRD